jgi:hypothetical protein
MCRSAATIIASFRLLGGGATEIAGAGWWPNAGPILVVSDLENMCWRMGGWLSRAGVGAMGSRIDPISIAAMPQSGGHRFAATVEAAGADCIAKNRTVELFIRQARCGSRPMRIG